MPCNLTSSSATQLVCQLGANSGLYANFNYNLEVLVKGKGYALQGDTFQLQFTPKVDSLSATTGSVAGGTQLIISGDGFIPESTLVIIGDTAYYNNRNGVRINATHIVLKTAAQEEATLDVRVVVNNINASCGTCTFSYSDSISPELTSVSPLTVSGSTQISLQGSKFGSDATKVHVMIGASECVVASVANDSQIECQVAGVEAGDQLVQVTVEGVGLAKASTGFFISSQLKVVSVSPSAGSIHGGSVVTVTGNGFGPGTRLSFGGYPCLIRSVLPDQITCRTTDSTATPVSTPAPPTTTRTTTTQAPSTTTKLVDQCLSDYRAAMLTAHNTYRTLHATANMSSNSAAEQVAQNYAKYLADNSLWLHSHTAGYGENLAKTWSSQVTSLSDCAKYGAKFAQMWYDEIAFYDYSNPGKNKPGTTNAIGHFTQLVWKDSTGLGCGLAIGPDYYVYGVCEYTPPGNYIGAQNYADNVLPLSVSRRRRSAVQDTPLALLVTNYADSLNAVAATFTYDTSVSPSVASVSPNSGSGGQVTISGSGFGVDADSVSVKVGMVDCQVTAVTDVQVTCVLESGSAGAQPVVVSVAQIGDSNRNVQYTYSLSVTGLSQVEGSIGGGLSLQISGSGFSNLTSVTICGRTCPLKGQTSLSAVTCTVPDAVVKNADSVCTVSVAENGQTATSTFTYRLALTPVISSSSPARGGTGGGTLLTITGSGFPNDQTMVKVSIAGATCDITAISSTQILCRTGSFAGSSLKALVSVAITGNGLALNVRIF